MENLTCTFWKLNDTHLGIINQSHCQHCEQKVSSANQNDKRTWYCSFCDRNRNVKSETGHINSNFHKRRERFALSVKKHQFDNPEFTQIDITLEDVLKDFKGKYFHAFEYRCENDMKFERKTSTDEVCYFTINNGSTLFSYLSDRLHKEFVVKLNKVLQIQ